MKRHYRMGSILTVCLVTVYAMGTCLAAGHKADKKVKMNVIGESLEISSKKDENGCKIRWLQTRNKGCVEVEYGNWAEIVFELTGTTTCNIENGKSWVMSEVFLGGYNSGDKPQAYGFNDSEYAIVSQDFSIVDQGSGRVAPDSQTEKTLVISDQNKAEYDVWYKVTADCVDRDGKVLKTISTDPRIRNGGGN